MIVRNDDVSVDTCVADLQRFCDICDRRGLKILQGITVMGNTGSKIDYRMTNDQIKALGGGLVFENEELIDYLIQRNDLIAVHGLWHTHEPSESEIESAKRMLTRVYLKPTYFIPPFNEGEYENEVCGLKVSTKDAQNIEHYFQTEDVPITEIAYTHYWRYSKWYPWEKLEECLDRILK
jgi:hypothetical protein